VETSRGNYVNYAFIYTSNTTSSFPAPNRKCIKKKLFFFTDRGSGRGRGSNGESTKEGRRGISWSANCSEEQERTRIGLEIEIEIAISEKRFNGD
jgi:hypothetical protein